MQPKKTPLRKCAGCGEMIGKKGALRVVRDKDGVISIDLTGKKAGRGAYICRDSKCLELAKKRRGLEHSLKKPISAEIYEELEKELDSDK